MTNATNPSAFPYDPSTTIGATEGMTLRDWFAAFVVGGMAARDSYDAGQATPEDRARLAYIEADAMLAERATGAA